MALGGIAVREAGAQTHTPMDPLVPINTLARNNEIDDILRPVVEAGRKEVHAAIERVLKEWPGRRRSEIRARLRHLRNEGHKRSRCRAIWSEEDLQILRTYYVQGRAGARRAVKRLLERHQGWTPQVVWYKAEKLGIANRRTKLQPWSREEHGYLLWNAGEKPVRRIARRLGRSASSKLRTPEQYTLHRVSRLLGVSDAVVRLWFHQSLFCDPANRGKKLQRSQSELRVSAAALIAFCQNHPDKINTRQCHPDFWVLLEDKDVQPNAWKGTRQHLTKLRDCPGCERVIRGNVYYHHIKTCRGAATRAALVGPEVETTVQRSVSSNV